MVNSTRKVTTDETGTLIWEGNTSRLASVLITFDSAAYWGFGDLSQALTPVASEGMFVLDWQAFPPESRQKGEIVRIYAKRQTAGTLQCYVNYLEA